MMTVQRLALTAWLRDLPPALWNESVRSVLADLCRHYAAAVGSDLVVSVPDDPKGAADVVERIGRAAELAAAEQGAGDPGMDDVFGRACDAAVAAVVWRAADKVEAPVRIILETGGDYVVGAGEPEAVLRTDHEAVLEVAGGRADPAELARSGRWRFDGTDDARRAFERTFPL